MKAPLICPVCKSEEYEIESSEISSDNLCIMFLFCNECETEWTETLKLIEYEVTYNSKEEE